LATTNAAKPEKEASMDLHLTNKKALVTGSTAGIGFAVASLLAQEGAAVVVNGRSQGRVDAAVKRLQSEKKDAEVTGVAADLGTKEGVNTLTRQLPAVDILVNNLGIFEPKPFTEISDEEWRRFFEVNVLSGVRLSRFYLPQMIQKNWGRIVFISSESGVNIPVEMIHYGVTKTAQIALARGLAETTASTNVTVNSVLPGPTRSEGVEQFVADLAKTQGSDEASVEREFFRSVRPSSLLKRFATPEEVAAMVVYVCSPRASATNGAALRVDGGVVRSIV
jgi:NAD(P)-dependent dehydrogenase (short-subunit alcohol dehydrogenase family)